MILLSYRMNFIYYDDNKLFCYGIYLIYIALCLVYYSGESMYNINGTIVATFTIYAIF